MSNKDDWTHTRKIWPDEEYRIGAHGLVYRWALGEWVRTTVTPDELETPEERKQRLGRFR